MSVDDVITLASIIEKEAYGDEQMPLVSSVLHNRLRMNGQFPTLQCNATKDYVDNFIAKRVNDPNKVNQFMSAYNTYKCEGLPIGAICNPGDSAINCEVNHSIAAQAIGSMDNTGNLTSCVYIIVCSSK